MVYNPEAFREKKFDVVINECQEQFKIVAFELNQILSRIDVINKETKMIKKLQNFAISKSEFLYRRQGGGERTCHKAGWREPQMRMRRASDSAIYIYIRYPLQFLRFSLTATAVPLILFINSRLISDRPPSLSRLTHFTIRVSLPLSLFSFPISFLVYVFHLFFIPSFLAGYSIYTPDSFSVFPHWLFSFLLSSAFVHAPTHMRNRPA